jgi:hypothetical protein
MTRRRVGLIADTRIPEAGRDLPDEAYDALAGCDQILRCGDLHTIEVVDRVECLAPTIARRGSGDTFEPRIGRPGASARTSAFSDVFVLDVEGVPYRPDARRRRWPRADAMATSSRS